MSERKTTQSSIAAHISVLTKETIEGLALQGGSIVVDATLGAGGHSREILRVLKEEGTLIALDADNAAIQKGEALRDAEATVHLIAHNFRNLDTVLASLNITVVDAIVADLGWRTEQFLGNETEGGGKGFSFQKDEPLLMTYGDPSTYAFTARDIINEWEEEDIANVLKGYGEERFAKRIAHRITEVREAAPIETTAALVKVIEEAVPARFRHGKTHPATKTFQALRIAVNDELEALEELMEKGSAHLAPGGRMAVITFHSIEDRIVKHTFRQLARDHVGTVVTKKPITANDGELEQNPRARSAKLRIFEKAATNTT